MSTLKWENLPVPEYFNQGHIRYERRYVDVPAMGEGYQAVPLSFDITHFGIVYEKNNVVVHSNTESATGCFYIPFLPCEDKEDLSKRIHKIVNDIAFEMKDTNPFLRIFIFRHIDLLGKRNFAIGGTNCLPKHKLIHQLGIKTLQTTPKEPDSKESWDTVVSEMISEPKNVNCCQIDKEEIMEFEERKFPVPLSSKDVLIMLSSEEGFNAQHFSEPTKDSFHGFHFKGNGKKIDPGSVFKMRKIRLSCMNELNLSIKWMTEAYRALTGSSSVKTVAMYYEFPGGAIDASIISFKPVKPKLEEDEDEDDDEA